MSFDQIWKYCLRLVEFTPEELSIMEKYYIPTSLEKGSYLLEIGQKCSFIGFVNSGLIRHCHYNDGDEITCDFTGEDRFITDYVSFINEVNSNYNFRAIEDCELLIIDKNNLGALYKECPKFEILAGRIAEEMAMRNTSIAISLNVDKPEVRYKKLLQSNPSLFQRASQRHIASYLGIKPESLSRIRKRIIDSEKS